MASESGENPFRSAASDVAGSAKGNVGGIADAAGDLYDAGKRQAREVADELPAALSDAGASIETLALRGRRRLHQGVRKQPVEALLLAGAIGYLVGWATTRG